MALTVSMEEFISREIVDQRAGGEEQTLHTSGHQHPASHCSGAWERLSGMLLPSVVGFLKNTRKLGHILGDVAERRVHCRAAEFSMQLIGYSCCILDIVYSGYRLTV